MISEILEIIKENPSLASKLTPELPYIKAEIYYAASHEGALTVDDVISRRTRIAFEAESHGIKLAELISEIISPVLGWTNKERKASVSAYQSLVEREIDALAEVISQAHKVNS